MTILFEITGQVNNSPPQTEIRFFLMMDIFGSWRFTRNFVSIMTESDFQAHYVRKWSYKNTPDYYVPGWLV